MTFLKAVGLFLTLLVIAEISLTNGQNTVQLTVQSTNSFNGPQNMGSGMGHSSIDGNWIQFVKRLGVNAARFFVNPIFNVKTFVGNIWGNDLNNNTVSNLTEFYAAVAQLRTPNGRNPSYPWANPLKWTALYTTLTTVTTPVYGSYDNTVNQLNALKTMNSILMVQNIAFTNLPLTTQNTTLPIYWGERWELYKISYALAWYAASKGVNMIEFYNEPDLELGETPAGLNAAQYVDYMQVRSISMRAAYADWNAANPGNATNLQVLGPVSARLTYGGDPTQYLGSVAVQNNNYMFGYPQLNTNWTNFDIYSYHTYGKPGYSMWMDLNSTVLSIKNDPLATCGLMPVIITEHNSHTSASWNTINSTPDDIYEAATLATQIANVVAANITSHFVFKFSVTPSGVPGLTVAINGLHWGENYLDPYWISDTTLSAEAFRLLTVMKQSQIYRVANTDTTVLRTYIASRKPGDLFYYLFAVNGLGTAVNLNINLAAWNILSGTKIIIEQVGSGNWGQVSSIVTLSSTNVITVPLAPFATLRFSVQTGAQVSSSTTATFSNTLNAGAQSNVVNATSAANPSFYVGTSNTAAHESTSVAYLQFATPAGSSVRSILSIGVQNIIGPAINSNMTVMILGLSNVPAGWTSAAASWSLLSNNSTGTSSNILFPLSSGVQLTAVSQNFLNWASSTGIQIAGHLSVTSSSINQQVMVDVSDYVNSVVMAGGSTLTFLIYRPFRHPSFATAYGAISSDDLAGGSLIQFAGVGSATPPSLIQFSASIPPVVLPAVPPSSLISSIAASPITYNNVQATLVANPLYTIGSLYTQPQLSTLSLADTLSLLSSASLPVSTVDPNTALTLGSKLPATTTLPQAAKVLSGSPIQIILNSNPNAILSSLNNIDFINLGTAQFSTLANVLFAAPNTTILASVMQSGQAELIEYIPLTVFKTLQSTVVSGRKKRALPDLTNGINVDDFAGTELPKSVMHDHARKLMKSTTLETLVSDRPKLARVVSALRESDFSSLTAANKFTSVITIVEAGSAGRGFSHVQRKILFKNLIDGAAFKKGVTATVANAKAIFSHFSSTDFEKTADLFIEAPTEYLDVLSTMDTISFGYVLTKLAKYSTALCTTFSHATRSNFTIYAVKYLLYKDGRTTLHSTDLDSLSYCFAPTMPLEYFISLSAVDFYAKAHYFQGIQFQPSNSNWTTEISNKITSLAASNTIDSLFKNLGDLMIYYSSLNTVSSTIFATYGAAINKFLKTSKDLNNDQVKLARIGTNDDAPLKAALANWRSAYANYLISSGANSKKKRAVNPISCEQLTNGPAYAFSPAQLSSTYISSTVFTSCMNVLGASSNYYSTDQLTALANLAIGYGYTSATLNDAILQSLNQILLGYPTAELSTLRFTSRNTISKLGALTTWSSAQLTALMTALANNGFTVTSELNTIGNLACGFTGAQVSSLTNSTIVSNMAVLKTINNVPCPALSSFYEKAKIANDIITLEASSVTDLNALVGGASITDLTTMSSEVFSALTPLAIKNLQNNTVNSLPISIFSYATTTQISAFLSSPYYQYYSDSVKTALALISGAKSYSSTSIITGGSGSSSSRITASIAEYLICFLLAVISKLNI